MILAFLSNSRERHNVFINADDIRFGEDKDGNLCIWDGQHWYWIFFENECFADTSRQSKDELNKSFFDKIVEAIKDEKQGFLREIDLRLSRVCLVKVFAYGN